MPRRSYLPPSARMRQIKRDKPPRPTPKVKAAPASKPKAKAAPAPKPVPAPEPEPVRARTEEGHFVPDDPATPEVNEAFEGGKPLRPEWNARMRKDDLLAVAHQAGLSHLTDDDTKAAIVAALEEADV